MHVGVIPAFRECPFTNLNVMANELNITRGCSDIKSDGADAHTCKLDEGCKLHVTDWLEDIPTTETMHDIVEVRFKNTRKGFYKNVNQLSLSVGDIVAVEASPGHDIGIVSLTGELVHEQMRRNEADTRNAEYKKVYRKAKSSDVDKWKEAISLEHLTMIKARKIAVDLRLNMKIGDVEYQGDRTKAIFYYIADDRVDFRELIKVLADAFKVRIEMKQIGARQEAGRIGGIGSCGRELCCSSWMVNFVSVSTTSAKYQELSLNPKKLAGQCIKLKCCLNYELDTYMDARKDFPDPSVALETQSGLAYHHKTDVHRRMMWYGFSGNENEPMNLIPMPVERVKEVMDLNKRGIKVKTLAVIEDDKPIADFTSQERPMHQQRPGQGQRPHQDNQQRHSKQQPGQHQVQQQNHNRNKNRNQDRRNRPNNEQGQQAQGTEQQAQGQNPNQNQNPNRNQNQNRNQNRNQNNQRNDRRNEQRNDQRNNPNNQQGGDRSEQRTVIRKSDLPKDTPSNPNPTNPTEQ